MCCCLPGALLANKESRKRYSLPLLAAAVVLFTISVTESVRWARWVWFDGIQLETVAAGSHPDSIDPSNNPHVAFLFESDEVVLVGKGHMRVWRDDFCEREKKRGGKFTCTASCVAPLAWKSDNRDYTNTSYLGSKGPVAWAGCIFEFALAANPLDPSKPQIAPNSITSMVTCDQVCGRERNFTDAPGARRRLNIAGTQTVVEFFVRIGDGWRFADKDIVTDKVTSDGDYDEPSQQVTAPLKATMIRHDYRYGKKIESIGAVFKEHIEALSLELGWSVTAGQWGAGNTDVEKNFDDANWFIGSCDDCPLVLDVGPYPYDYYADRARADFWIVFGVFAGVFAMLWVCQLCWLCPGLFSLFCRDD
jgi:hypothetical protein